MTWCRPSHPRAVVFAVVAFMDYWLAATFVPPLVLRIVFNPPAFGAALIITKTWAPSAIKAVQENVDMGEWQLILATFLVWFIVLCNRVYIIVFNWVGRPDSSAVSEVAGFWPYSYLIAGLLFLAAPGVKSEGIESWAIWAILAAVAIGSLVAGIPIGFSISTVEIYFNAICWQCFRARYWKPPMAFRRSESLA